MKKRIYLDACMVIDLVEGETSEQEMLASRLAGHRVYGSELVRMEARIKALKESRRDFLAEYDRYFNACQLVALERKLFDVAASLRIEHGLKTPDALHLAAAIGAGCDTFWTNDGRLADVAAKLLAVETWETLKHPSSSQMP